MRNNGFNQRCTGVFDFLDPLARQAFAFGLLTRAWSQYSHFIALLSFQFICRTFIASLWDVVDKIVNILNCLNLVLLL